MDANNPGIHTTPDDASRGESFAGGVVFVLMAGGFSPPPLGVAVGCSVLDLHLTPEQTVLGRWLWAVSTLHRAGVVEAGMCLCGGSTPLPQSTVGSFRTIVDKNDYRGPAGSLRDACETLAPETTIIAAEAARCCTIDLGRLLGRHAQSGAEVTVGRNADQSPAGVYLLRRSVLDTVPHAGFMDLKEQWLGKLVAAGREVRVHELRESGATLLRTRAEFLDAMHLCSGIERPGTAGDLEPRVLRQTRRAGSVVCGGAEVSPEAVLVDSLVMPGARVEAGALVARSIIASGCVVRAGEELVDAVVGPGGVTRDGTGGRGGSR